jgi:carboxymethylenebutenolidase
MKSYCRPALLALVALSAACPPNAAPRDAAPQDTTPQDTAPLYRASQLEVVISGGEYALRAELLIPHGKGPFPAIVYNHGSERDPSLRWMGATGRWFQENGFVALFPYRRGCNGSEGPYWSDEVESYPYEERARATVQALEAQSEDVLTAVDWLARRPEVDPKLIFVAGCSFGGIVSVFAAERGDGLRGAIDFAGASMTWAENEWLRDRMRRAVRGAKVPVFLLQAENDFNIAPTLELSAEMEIMGLSHDKKIFPPHGTTPMEGHAHFCNQGQDDWGPDVLAFLRKWGATPGQKAH